MTLKYNVEDETKTALVLSNVLVQPRRLSIILRHSSPHHSIKKLPKIIFVDTRFGKVGIPEDIFAYIFSELHALCQMPQRKIS